MAKRTRPARLRLPDELTGDFTGLVIGTFGAALDFAEAQLFRQLSRSTVSRVVLADERQLAEFLAKEPPLRRLNRAYIACPVTSPHAHHPKYLLLVGPDAGRLFVGSGNLSISGYAGPGECFTVHDWAKNHSEADASAFGAVRELIEGTIAKSWLDQVTRERIRDIFSAAPWVPTDGGPASPVVHNLHRPLLDQLIERVGGARVDEVVAAAPFHDKSGYAVSQILKQLAPARFRLLVQDRLTRFDVGALARVLARRIRAEIVEVSPAAPYPNTLVHAKFVLVRTRAADVLLQGSANLSRIALCEAGPNANVEIANLLTGAGGEYDHLLDALLLKVRRDGLATFTPNDDWGDQHDAQPAARGPRDVCWTPPTLSGHVPVSAHPTIEVRVGATAVTPTQQRWDILPTSCQFSLDFDESAAARIDSARAIELIDVAGIAWSVYPYHLHSLMRLSASGSRADLLQETGNLDLRDKELEELVAELDRVLIVDGRSLWRLAHPETPAPELDSDAAGPPLHYEDLDWKRIGELPQLKQYGSAAHRALLAPTELGIVLQSLSRRFRVDVRVGMGDRDIDAAEPDDLAAEQESEDADLLDEIAPEPDDGADEDDSPPRRLAPRQRVRRLWRNFVRRFVRGLADVEFVRTVGSAVIVPSYVVFNHLCRRLRVVDLVDADFLTDAQVQLWSFMWGDSSGAGYLAGLPEDELEVAQKILADHDDLAATLAAVDDAWWHVREEGEDAIPLRSAWRSFLEAELWEPEPQALQRAAAVSIRCEADEGRLFHDLYALAAHFEHHELKKEIALCLGAVGTQLSTRSGTVYRGDSKEACTYLDVRGVRLTPELARAAFGVWKEFEPDRVYFRLETDGAIAAVDLEHHNGFLFDRQTQREMPLQMGDRAKSRWEARLALLLAAA
jgi:hypothetical protein